MNDLVVADRAADWRRLKALVLDSASSPITKRVYNLGLDEFFAWYSQEPRAGLTKATVSAWRVALEASGLGSVSINVRITAVRKLAVEAADNGLLAPELAAGIARVKGAKSIGVRVGNWLSLRQAQTLLNTPDVTTKKGLRDRAMLAVLLGCGLRRSEVAALTLKHIQQRDSRWCIVDLVGKHGRVRTIPMPTWVKSAIDAWTTPVGLTEGYVLRPVSRGDQIRGERLTEKVIWQLLRPYALAAGVPGIAPHDLRRSCAKMCRAAGGELEQIQLLLGHCPYQILRLTKNQGLGRHSCDIVTGVIERAWEYGSGFRTLRDAVSRCHNNPSEIVSARPGPFRESAAKLGTSDGNNVQAGND